MSLRQMRRNLNDSTNMFFCHVAAWAIDSDCNLCIHLQGWILRSLKTQAFLFLVLPTPTAMTLNMSSSKSAGWFFSKLSNVRCLLLKWSWRTRRLQSCPLQTVSLNGSAMLSFVSMLLFVCHWAVHEWNITGTSLTMSGLDACLARASVNHEVHVFTHEGFGCALCMHGPPYPSHCTFMGKLWFVFSFFPCALMWDALIPVAASSPIFPPCYQCPFFSFLGIGAPIISPAGSCP